MTHDDILVKIQLLADKVHALKEENRQLKEEKSLLNLTLSEVQSRADEVESDHKANSANLLLLKQKEELMVAALEDLQTNYDRNKIELETILQTLKEKDALLRQAELGVTQLSNELHETVYSLDEKNNHIRALEEKMASGEESWQALINEKDTIINQYKNELETATQKIQLLHTERESLTTQLDELITHLDGQIELLKSEANG